MNSTSIIWMFFLAASLVGAQQVSIIPALGDIQLGTDKIFICKAADGKEANFKWLRSDGDQIEEGVEERFEINIIDETTSSLVIRSARKEDGGQYRCVAEYENGTSDSATVNLNVIQSPKFSNVTTYQEFLEGSTAVLSCDVDGIPTPVVTWLYHGQDVILNGNVHFSLLPNKHLKIRPIHRSDGGTYRCEARIQERNEVDFRDISVVVNYPASAHFRKNSKNVTAGLKEISLACLLMGHPQPKVTWNRNGEELRAKGGKWLFNSDKTELTILSVDKTDEGEYSCKAENQFGQAETKMNLTVFAGGQTGAATHFIQESAEPTQGSEGCAVSSQEMGHLGAEVQQLRTDLQKELQEMRSHLAELKEIFRESLHPKLPPTPEIFAEANLFTGLSKSESALPDSAATTISNFPSAPPASVLLTAATPGTMGGSRRRKRSFSTVPAGQLP